MKNVLILGANSDVAKELSRIFARNGYELILAVRNPETAENLASDIRIRFGSKVSVVKFDAEKVESHRDFYLSLPSAPHVTVTAFGYLGDHEKAKKDFDETEKIIDVNYRGAVSVLNVIAEDLEARGAGTIIGLSSVAGDRGRQSNYFYGSAKAGFTAYLSGLRNRLAPAGVNVITVKPGMIRTKMTDGMDLPPLITASPEKVARDIFNAYVKGRTIIYTPSVWRSIMWIIRMIPESVFKKLNL